MNLKEQLEYLINHGFIKIAETDSTNLYEAGMYKEFVKDLETIDNRLADVDELEDKVDELQEEIYDLEDKIEELRNNKEEE